MKNIVVNVQIGKPNETLHCFIFLKSEYFLKCLPMYLKIQTITRTEYLMRFIFFIKLRKGLIVELAGWTFNFMFHDKRQVCKTIEKFMIYD